MRTIPPAATTALQIYGCIAAALCTSVAVADSDQPFLRPHSLVISSSTYDRSQGAIASLTVGTALPSSATATTTAIADNTYVNVWNNDSMDGSFGVTSPIRLTDIEAQSGRVLRTRVVPTDQVVTMSMQQIMPGLRNGLWPTAHGPSIMFSPRA